MIPLGRINYCVTGPLYSFLWQKNTNGLLVPHRSIKAWVKQGNYNLHILFVSNKDRKFQKKCKREKSDPTNSLTTCIGLLEQVAYRGGFGGEKVKIRICSQPGKQPCIYVVMVPSYWDKSLVSIDANYPKLKS